ncbi:hypothetical protein [Gelidibacter mesophilus]|uniref:hypothetical protein n=1 Tax=Gelidibacter mesophilus TaxID=169050 RepID=UPI00040C1563|nr:hypothetical protein [Gelidibacter mesophilus]
MKKIATLLFVVAIVLTGCTGDQGPMGPPGPPGNTGTPGEDGGIIVSSAFEIIIDFNADNKFSYTENYGSDIEVLPSDITLVYRLWETRDGKDVWRLMPQELNFENGNLVYNFDFTQTYVRIFLNGSTNFETLGQEWTQDQVFRVVVVPADNVDGIDLFNLDEVMQSYNIENFEMK